MNLFKVVDVEIMPTAVKGRQEDAHEFLISVLEMIKYNYMVLSTKLLYEHYVEITLPCCYHIPLICS
jgi:uncharacterized UBP type Zn finger protein